MKGKHVGLVLIGVLGVAGVASMLFDGQSQTSVKERPGLGRMVEVRDRAIIATKVEKLDGIRVDNQFATPINGDILVVRLTVANTGNESGNMMFSVFEVRDSQGRTYSEITDLTYSMWRDTQRVKARSEDLFPDESRLDLAAFRVSPDATGFTLLWNGEEIPLN